MIKTCVLLLFALVMSIVAFPAFAASDGFYFGVLTGSANTHYQAKNSDAKIDNTGVGSRLYVGYQWTRYWAAELGYTGYPNTSFKNIHQAGFEGRISESATDWVAKIMLLPLGCRLNAYAKAGVAYLDADGSRYLRGESKNAYCPTYGGGFSYDLNPNIPIVITWTRVQETNHIPNADLLSLGIEYHFG